MPDLKVIVVVKEVKSSIIVRNWNSLAAGWALEADVHPLFETDNVVTVTTWRDHILLVELVFNKGLWVLARLLLLLLALILGIMILLVILSRVWSS